MVRKSAFNIKKSAFDSAFSHKHLPKLTQTQSEILLMLTKEYLTPKQISIRRKTQIRATQKIIKQLKDLGLVTKDYRQVRFTQPTNAPNNKKIYDNFIRLHGEEFNIKILYKDKRYKDLLEKGNLVELDGNTIRLYKDSIEVYSGRSFYGEDPQKVTATAFEYWNRLFIKIENTYKIMICKPFINNKRRVNAHYAEVGNELSKSCEERGERIRVYSREDSKLWFIIDNSFSLHEAECIHPQDSKDDMDIVKSFFNDLRGGRWHEIMVKVETMFIFQEKYAENIKSHLEVLQEMKETLKEIRWKL